MGTVYALHDFVGENEDEITFYVGESIAVIEKDELYNDGWWQVSGGTVFLWWSGSPLTCRMMYRAVICEETSVCFHPTTYRQRSRCPSLTTTTTMTPTT